MGRRIRIVVGEGRTAQQGLLRFVLEGEGFEVARETKTVADLAIAVAEEQPDVVVLDDGIGVVAVSMVHEAVPRTKIVLVWPAAVVPIGGDARVEPAKILNDLGRTVREVLPVGVGAGLTESFNRPDWIDRIRKDPATLREKLEASGTDTAKRPSVTQLQKRGRRLHPGRRKETEEAAPAAVVALPVRQDAAGTPPGGVRAETAPDAPEERSEWNRRLGTLALSGAAAVSALVLALALGGSRLPPEFRGAGEIVVPPGTGFGGAPAQTGPFLGGVLGSDGYWPIPIVAPSGGDDDAGPTDGDAPTGGLLAPSGGSEEPVVEQPTDGGNGGNGGGGGGNGGGGSGGGGGGGNGGGGGGGGGGEVKQPSGNVNNPFGGSPSKLGLTPAHGQGLGNTFGAAADNAKAAGSTHAHKH